MEGLVGIVLVSHSGPLAEALAGLLAGLGCAPVPVVAAGGTAGGGLGTSPDAVRRAVAAADRGAGVAVLADLGSAVLTARLVLEETAGESAVLADAPFVEGAVAAAVTASTGAGLAAVVAAAEEARRLPGP